MSDDIPTTKIFLKFHGNYCGLGTRGGIPIDELDAACKRHDVGYHHIAKTKDPEANTKRIQYDLDLIKTADEISRDKSKSWNQRIKAKIISYFFRIVLIIHCLRKSK